MLNRHPRHHIPFCTPATAIAPIAHTHIHHPAGLEGAWQRLLHVVVDYGSRACWGAVLLTCCLAVCFAQVGQVVDFRTWQHGLRCATGWRSGVVLAMDAGSVWEGGSRFLVQPRHAHHSGSQPNLRSQASMPQPGSPAAAALAAMTAAGVPAAGEVATQAASKLLTPSGHLRHEVAGLIGTAYRPLSPGLSKLSLDPAGSLGSHSSLQGQRQQLAAAAGGGAAGAGAEADGQADASRPAWVPLLWRGTAQQPLPKPLVMVRPHSAAAAAQQQHAAGAPSQLGPAAAAATMNSTGASPFSRQQVQQQGQQQVSLGVQQLKPRMIIEALHQGCWWPAEVQAVKTVDAQEQQQQHLGAAGGGTPSSSVSGMAGAACCVVLKNLDPPEADGTVWRFSAGHTMRCVTAGALLVCMQQTSVHCPVCSSAFSSGQRQTVSATYAVLYDTSA